MSDRRDRNSDLDREPASPAWVSREPAEDLLKAIQELDLARAELNDLLDFFARPDLTIAQAEELISHVQGERQTVVERLACHEISLQFDQLTVHRDQVADLNEFVHLGGRQADVDQQLFGRDGFGVLTLVGWQDVGWAGAHYAGQATAAENENLLSQENPIIIAAHLLEVDEALLDFRYHQADLVHVGGEQYRGTRIGALAELVGNHIA